MRTISSTFVSLNALAFCGIAATLFATGSFAQDVPPIAPGTAIYSPYPAHDFPNQVLFGDTHLHTSYSTDAGMFGNTLGPDAAYRFAKGETVVSNTGVRGASHTMMEVQRGSLEHSSPSTTEPFVFPLLLP